MTTLNLRKKLLALVVCSIVLAVVLGYALLLERHSPQVSGSFSPEELGAVKRLARKEQKHQFFERLSWGIRRRETYVLRQALITLRPDYVLRSISDNPEGTVEVIIGTAGPYSHSDVYRMRKAANEWHVVEHFQRVTRPVEWRAGRGPSPK